MSSPFFLLNTVCFSPVCECFLSGVADCVVCWLLTWLLVASQHLYSPVCSLLLASSSVLPLHNSADQSLCLMLSQALWSHFSFRKPLFGALTRVKIFSQTTIQLTSMILSCYSPAETPHSVCLPAVLYSTISYYSFGSEITLRKDYFPAFPDLLWKCLV